MTTIQVQFIQQTTGNPVYNVQLNYPDRDGIIQAVRLDTSQSRVVSRFCRNTLAKRECRPAVSNSWLVG